MSGTFKQAQHEGMVERGHAQDAFEIFAESSTWERNHDRENNSLLVATPRRTAETSCIDILALASRKKKAKLKQHSCQHAGIAGTKESQLGYMNMC